MAIISIPTSIGGVTIPGTTTKGPLGALFDSKYRLGSLQYPRDLGSATKGHVVKFSINEIEPTGYEEGREYTLPSITNPTDIWNSVTKLVGGETKINQTLKPKKKRVASTISLYMPDTVNFQYNSGYSNLSLMDVAKDTAGAVSNLPLVSKLGKMASLGISVVQSNAAKLALSTQGLAINPQQQLLFDGIDFREYQMAFTFTPYSQQEADDVKKIIQLFRAHAAPRIITGGAGMFFVPPSTFDLQFFLNGIENKNISKVAESVITSVDVNYAPNGWASHADGAPVQTTLTMNFKEIELIDRKKIEGGY
jgi:hypothetical protein